MLDYKILFKSKSSRMKILKFFDFLPDSMMVRIQYFISTGRILNLNGNRFTEKIQSYKLNYRNGLITQCSDKYLVRNFVVDRGLGEFLVPLIGVYSNVDQIDFSTLPECFVLKTNNGSHTNIICESKECLDLTQARDNMNLWLGDWEGKVGREWSYYNIEPKIICEELLPKDNRGDLVDYKFFCFDGEPHFLYVIEDRFLDDGIKLGIYDTEFNRISANRSDIAPLIRDVDMPKSFGEMLEIVRVLSKGFPHVRVDLYNIEGKIYFGEMTFYDGSGYKGFIPDHFDLEVGSKFFL
jgi:hypothetical protein